MTIRAILTTALISISGVAMSQTMSNDSVAMGVGYANDVFYNLQDGSTKLQQGNDWHIALQMTLFGTPSFNAAIRANHARTGMEVYVINNTAPNTFSSVGAADTVGKTSPSMSLSNNDTSWGTGAFYQNRNISDPFSYGWGEYAGSPTHAVNGYTTYLIKLANGSCYKFWMKKYTSWVQNQGDTIGYVFEIAHLDGTADRVVTIRRQSANFDFTNSLMAYYNIDSDRIENREPRITKWDMLFTQYRDSVAMGPGPQVLYTVTGVLTNQGVQMINAHVVNPSTTGFKTFAYQPAINTIGYNWKTYVNPGPNGYYQLDTTANYFIKVPSTLGGADFYQLQFTRFDGGGSAGQGKIVFAKRKLGTTVGVTTINTNSINKWFVVPNPATNEASVMIDAQTATPFAQMMVMDMAGHVVFNAPVSVKQGMNAFSLDLKSWSAGMYLVKISGGDINVSTRLVVAH